MAKKKTEERSEGQLSFSDDGVGMTGEWMVKKCDEWIAKNPEIWSDMLSRAAMFVSQGRRFSMENLIQFARYSRDPDGVTAFKVDNNIRSALARKMLLKYPHWSKFVETRDSKVDWV